MSIIHTSKLHNDDIITRSNAYNYVIFSTFTYSCFIVSNDNDTLCQISSIPGPPTILYYITVYPHPILHLNLIKLSVFDYHPIFNQKFIYFHPSTLLVGFLPFPLIIIQSNLIFIIIIHQQT